MRQGTWRKVALGLATMAMAAGLLVISPSAEAAVGDITLFNTAGLFPTGGIVEGPDGMLWFTNPTDKIGEINPNTGVITLHTDARLNTPSDITVGGDGNLWFTNTLDNEIGRYNPTTDVIDLFPSGNIFPFKIATGADGSVWYTAGGGDAQQMLTTGTPGTLGQQTPSLGTVGDIILGADGNLWITKSNAGAPGTSHSLLRVNPANGNVTPFPTPGNIEPRQITRGPDDVFYFTFGAGNGGIGRYDISLNDFDTANFTSSLNAKGITLGPDGNLWFLTASDNQVNRINQGLTSLVQFGTATMDIGPSPHEITVGPDDNLWATTEGSADRIAKVSMVAPPPTCDGLPITVNLNLAQSPTAGDDVILGTPVGETINALGGNDRVCGAAGTDIVNGGPGNDRLFGQNGPDTLNGQGNNDTLNGGKGSDRLNGGANTDSCNGSTGTDSQTGCETRVSIP